MSGLPGPFFDRSAALTPEQLSDVATGTPLQIDVLSAGGGLNKSRQFGAPGHWGIDITDLDCHVRAGGALHRDLVAILTVEQEADATICGTPMRESTMLIIPGGAEVEANILPGLRYSTAIVPAAEWLAIESAVTGGEARMARGPSAFRASGKRASLIRSSLAALPGAIAARDRGPAPGLPGDLSDYLAAIAEARWDAQSEAVLPGRAFRHRLSQARAARDYIFAHLGEDISIVQLCQAANASRRQLEYAFHSVFGLGPAQFIQRTRLNECRRQLKVARDDGRSVTQVALELGFNHLGRFAASYRQLFGELPSHTYE